MLAVVILAGGKATRLPGKLELDAGGEPLIVRVYRNVRGAGNVYVSANGAFPQSIARDIDSPVIPDEQLEQGPLRALHSSFSAIAEPRVFVVAADMPFVTADVANELLEHWTDGADGVAALDASGQVQPLCAVYDRVRFLQAAGAALEQGKRSVKAALDGLNIVRARLRDDRTIRGVNTPEDWIAVRTFDLGIHPRA